MSTINSQRDYQHSKLLHLVLIIISTIIYIHLIIFPLNYLFGWLC